MSASVVEKFHLSENGRRLYNALLKNPQTALLLRRAGLTVGYIPNSTVFLFGEVIQYQMPRRGDNVYQVTVLHIKNRGDSHYYIQDYDEDYDWITTDDPEVVVTELIRLIQKRIVKPATRQ